MSFDSLTDSQLRKCLTQITDKLELQWKKLEPMLKEYDLVLKEMNTIIQECEKRGLIDNEKQS